MSDTDSGAPFGTGSHPSGHAASGVDGASRFDPSRGEKWFPMRIAPRDGSRFIARTTTPGWSAVDHCRYVHRLDRLPVREAGGMWPSVPTEWRPSDCPFCNLQDIKSDVRDFGDVVAFESLNPVAAGHLLVVPRAHVMDFTQEPATSAATMAAASSLASELGGAFNLITSKGVEATQSVGHLHIHLVPRREGDGLLLPWSRSSDGKLERRNAK